MIGPVSPVCIERDDRPVLHWVNPFRSTIRLFHRLKSGSFFYAESDGEKEKQKNETTKHQNFGPDQSCVSLWPALDWFLILAFLFLFLAAFRSTYHAVKLKASDLYLVFQIFFFLFRFLIRRPPWLLGFYWTGTVGHRL